MNCQNYISLQISDRHVAIVFSSNSDSSKSDHVFGGFDTRDVQNPSKSQEPDYGQLVSY